MNDKFVARSLMLAIALLSLIVWSCRVSETPEKSANYLTETSGDVAFGKTNIETYTLEIRASMEKLYHDKFGLFVHWGPYAQLGGYWKGEKETGEWIMHKARIPIEEYE